MSGVSRGVDAMHLQDLKRWHWVVIAIPIGIVLSFAWTSMEPTVPRHIGQETFEWQLRAAPIEGNPWLDHLVVHPPREGVMVVTGEELVLRPNEKVADYKPFAFNALTPYQPLAPQRRNAPPPPQADPNETVLTYLTKLAAKNPQIQFRYAWEQQPAVVYALWTGGAIALIGGVWPTLLGLLVGAGWGHVDDEADDYDLSRFGGGKESATGSAIGLSAQHFKEVEAELEKNLQGFGSASSAAMSDVPPPELRKLEGGPVEATPLPNDDPNREYQGEFYPVVKPHGKPKE
jgi:hypothetical protein